VVTRRCVLPLGIVVCVFLLAGPAQGVIKIEKPLSKTFELSKAVFAGTVTKTNADNRLLEVKVTDTFKGDSPGETVRVQITSPEELFKDVAVDQPVVVFVDKALGGSIATLNLADTWVLANLVPNANPQAWQVVKLNDQARKSYPGRTSALVALLGQFKAGKGTLVNAIEQNVFRGGAKDLGNLKVKPTFLLTAKLGAEGKPHLLVGTADGVRLLAPAATGHEDKTQDWGLAGAKGAWAAFGDVSGDKRPDLLLGTTLYINDGRKFTASKVALDIKEPPLAVAICQAPADKTADVAVLYKSGKLIVYRNPGGADKPWSAGPEKALWGTEAKPAFAAFFGDWGDTGKTHVMVVREAGVTRYALDADGGPPADLARLTGATLADISKTEADGMKLLGAVPLDVDGDGRLDLLVVSEQGGFALVNRGFGCYLVNPDAVSALKPGGAKKAPFTLKLTTLLAGADLAADKFDDVLVLTEDGALFVVDNTPFPPPP